jgi:beta-1,2-mannobiose phosphorylase / 1,2-beta-oligomannan phosphorylase
MAVKAPPYRLERLGVVMEPLPGEPREAEGVLNPASARGRDGELYLFPRLVARGNYSRIGRARVRFDEGGTPSGVERLGVVLEPDEAWEQNPVTAGVEDPRITFVESLDAYVMTYAAYGPLGPRIGLAVSHDLVTWERLGPVSFIYQPSLRTDLNLYPNKDAMFFPEPVPGRLQAGRCPPTSRIRGRASGYRSLRLMRSWVTCMRSRDSAGTTRWRSRSSRGRRRRLAAEPRQSAFRRGG